MALVRILSLGGLSVLNTFGYTDGRGGLCGQVTEIWGLPKSFLLLGVQIMVLFPCHPKWGFGDINSIRNS